MTVTEYKKSKVRKPCDFTFCLGELNVADAVIAGVSDIQRFVHDRDAGGPIERGAERRSVSFAAHSTAGQRCHLVIVYIQ